MRVRICPHCGARAEADWRFCVACNRLLAARAPQAPAKRAGSNGVVVFLTGAAAVLVLVLFVGALLLHRFVSSLGDVEARPAATPTARTLDDAGELEASFAGYPYHCKRDGDAAVAVFAERMLPRDDDVLVGAIRDVVARAYGDEAYGTPSLVDWGVGSGPTRAIRIEGGSGAYVVVPYKEDTGEIHSLAITRVPR